MCKRGDIYYVDFGQDMRTRKTRGMRPVVVVSNNKANTHSLVITVVPLTSRVGKKQYLPTHVLIPETASNGLNRPSMALAEQVEALDKERLMCYKGRVTDQQVMTRITQALQVQLGVFEQYN